MELIVKKANGNILINAREVEIMVEEQLKMIPGIVEVGQKGIIGRLKEFFRYEDNKPVSIYPVGECVIGITCHVQISSDVNFVALSKSVQDIVKFSVQKHYGLEVEHVDILIEGLIER